MKQVKIGNVCLGKGRPKICVPLTAKNKEELFAWADRLTENPATEIAEWRIDWFEGLTQEVLCTVLPVLKAHLKAIPVLVTFRTKAEGGETAIEAECYVELLKTAIAAGADAVDVELSMGESVMKAVLEEAHRKGVPVIASKHDFEKTPQDEEMEESLLQMHQLGADICKLAVMPQGTEDVIRLLTITEKLSREVSSMTLITMSMAGLGAVTRAAGETVGSVMTFGCIGKASAPGQIEAESLLQILEALHS